ncbi:hypothetical protein [Lactiplantibacillus daowaiensis]|uniref:Integral membrane protein n=1 Tax=Lactiplantibacillus daowaiensis TaxID=2559918 RepID=A0ABW1S1Z3_9LACO|nr:hypothetical protein [Lactiplantibacillus daowaiensis]
MMRLTKGLHWLAAGILCWAIVFASTQPVKFFADQDWVRPGVMLILTVGVLLIWQGGRRWTTRWSPLTYRRVLWGVAGLIIMTQLIVAWQFVDVGRSDAYFVRNQAIALAHGSTTWNHYFAVYPNNVNFTLLASLSLKLMLGLGLNSPWIALNMLRFIWLDTTLVAGLTILRRWRHWQPGALSLMVIWLVSVPVYAYALFAYTDVLVMPIPIVSLALGLWLTKQRGWRRWAIGIGACLLISFGVLVKSNLIVVWLAAALIILASGWRQHLNWTWLGMLLLTLAGWWFGFHLWATTAGYQKQPQTALPATSWIAMSLNPQLDGQYNRADFKQVEQQPTAQAKQATAKTMIAQRLQQLGLNGSLQHLAKKFRVFWATGDFDSFKLTTQWLRAPNWVLQHQRAVQFWLVTWTQTLFLSLLLGSAWTWFTARKRRLALSYLALIVIGLTVFHVGLWEVEARYALPLLPILMLLGSDATATVPSWTWCYGRSRWLISWLIILGVGFSGLSILQTSQTTMVKSQIVARQGNGAYFQATKTALAPQQTVTLTLPANGRNNQLGLQPTGKTGRVQITVRHAGHLVKQVTGTTNQLATITYPTQTAGQLTVTIKNQSPHAVHYQVARANYNQASGRVTTNTHVYWRYFVLNRTTAQPLTRIRTIGLNLLIWLTLSLGLLWWQPRPTEIDV